MGLKTIKLIYSSFLWCLNHCNLWHFFQLKLTVVRKWYLSLFLNARAGWKNQDKRRKEHPAVLLQLSHLCTVPPNEHRHMHKLHFAVLLWEETCILMPVVWKHMCLVRVSHERQDLEPIIGAGFMFIPVRLQLQLP